jgi:3-hydroxybutyryl-CoA dehydrogenase
MIKNISIIGAGTMGHGIAHVFARHGYQISLYDSFEASVASAPEKMRQELEFMVSEKYISAEAVEETLNNITMFSNLEAAVKNADYVIEAIPERMDLKKELFGNLDKMCPPHTIFATNTSSLKLSEMIEDLPPARQERCMVSHWYNPAYLIPLVELSCFEGMNQEAFAEVYELYIQSEKQPIRVKKDIPGMIANRLLHCQAREVFHLLEVDAASPEDIDKALKYGVSFRNATTGMLECADMGGIDIWYAAESNFFPDLADNKVPSALMAKLVEEGNYGIKTGKGFYEYPEETRQETQTAFFKRLITQLKASDNY